jgi:hypothetical protein
MQNYEKHPRAKIAIPVRFQGLGANTLSNPTASVSPAGLTIHSTVVAADGKGLVVLVGGGTADTVYQVEPECDISNGEHPVGEFTVTIKDN